MEVNLSEMPIMFIRSDGGPALSSKAFNKLESGLKSLKGRKFYGLINGDNYLAGVVINKEDNPSEIGAEVGVIPGGKYFKEIINDWPHNLDKIKPTFEKMESEHKIDRLRPCMEFYKSQTELVLYLPIIGELVGPTAILRLPPMIR